MKKIALFTLVAGLFISVQAQDKITNKEGSDYEFTVVTDIEATDMKAKENRYLLEFSALSFIESEIMRLGGGKHELSEMFIVRNTYSDKAERDMCVCRNLNFGPGGAFHDVSEMIKAHGIVPMTYAGFSQ